MSFIEGFTGKKTTGQWITGKQVTRKKVIWNGATVLLLSMILSSCAINDIKDEDSTFYAVPEGSSLKLNQDVTISGDQVSVYVQNGKLLLEKEVDKYQPNCKFEVYKISEQPRTVYADVFEIIKIEDDIESSALKAKTQLAALADTRTNDASTNMNLAMDLDRSEMFNYVTLMYLNSDKQKDVYRMSCQHWESVMDDRHLSITQMRQAMGDIFTLQLPNSKAVEP